MRIQSQSHIQRLFHRGLKKLDALNCSLKDDETRILQWKKNDRAIATLKRFIDIEKAESDISNILNKWVKAA